MKIYKKIQMILVVALSCVMCFCGCGKEKQTVDFSGIKSICELATLKCYYHNVAKTEHDASGIFGKILKTGYKRYGLNMRGLSNVGLILTK